MKTSNSLLFFGSGPVALESLKALHGHFEIEAVVTKPNPDPRRTGVPPVVEWAQKQNLTLHQPTDKDSLEQLFKEQHFSSRLGVVVDYGLIIPKSVIDSFELGIANSHFSLLPRWRGADPITFSLLAGDAQTGVSVMLIEPELDTGLLLTQVTYDISPNETIDQLTHNLTQLSSKTLIKTLPGYLDGSIEPYPQDESQEVTYSRKLTKQDGVVDWNKDAKTLEREVRAYLTWPKSQAMIGAQPVIITQSHVVAGSGIPGKPFVTDQGELAVYTGRDALVIDKLKVPGKAGMPGQAYLTGYKII